MYTPGSWLASLFIFLAGSPENGEAAADTAAGLGVTGFAGLAGQLFLYIFLFVAFFYIVYLVYKHFLPRGNRARSFGFGKSRNMKVLEIASVGPGSTIQLVKVSEEYFLVGVTRTQITFMTKLDSASMAALYPDSEGTDLPKPKFLEFLSNRSQKSKDEP